MSNFWQTGGSHLAVSCNERYNPPLDGRPLFAENCSLISALIMVVLYIIAQHFVNQVLCHVHQCHDHVYLNLGLVYIKEDLVNIEIMSVKFELAPT